MFGSEVLKKKTEDKSTIKLISERGKAGLFTSECFPCLLFLTQQEPLTLQGKHLEEGNSGFNIDGWGKGV